MFSAQRRQRNEQTSQNSALALTKKATKNDFTNTITGLSMHGNLLAACEDGGKNKLVIYERNGEADLKPIFLHAFVGRVDDLKWAPSGEFLAVSGMTSTWTMNNYVVIAKLFIISKNKDSNKAI